MGYTARQLAFDLYAKRQRSVSQPSGPRAEARPGRCRHQRSEIMKKLGQHIIPMAALLLAACGGGGGDSAPPQSYALDAAQGHLLTEPSSRTMTGTGSDGQTYTITLAFTPLAAAPFPVNGIVSSVVRQTMTVTSPAGGTGSVDLSIFFNAPDLALVGWDYGDGTCSLGTASTALPTTASLGTGGPLFVQSDLDGCTGGAAPVGTSTTRWTLESDGGVSLLCWNMTAKDLTGAANGQLVSCFEVNPDGTLGGKARFSISDSTFSISARNF
jgi:hypothetical protein